MFGMLIEAGKAGRSVTAGKAASDMIACRKKPNELIFGPVVPSVNQCGLQ